MLSTAPAEAASCCPPQALCRNSRRAALRIAGAPCREHCPTENSDQVFWCRRRDSNSHSFRHYPLKIACLPISPRRLGEKQYCLAPGFQALKSFCRGFCLCLSPIAGESFQALDSNPLCCIVQRTTAKKIRNRIQGRLIISEQRAQPEPRRPQPLQQAPKHQPEPARKPGPSPSRPTMQQACSCPSASGSACR